ncbi:MAG: caspase family protein, partial [Candidatus Methanomethylicus sp.]|nr:caspase family protein [Candidatus Methanomethylicus sp.]
QLLKEIQSKTTENKTSNGSVVIYSASKGQLASDGPPGGNSPFMKAFLGALDDPNEELSDVFRYIRRKMELEQSIKQTPIIEDSRSVTFYFNRPDQDPKNGILRILVYDSCRDNPFRIRRPS